MAKETGSGAETGMVRESVCEIVTGRTGRGTATENGRRSLAGRGSVNAIGSETGIVTVIGIGTGIARMRRNATVGKIERPLEMLQPPLLHRLWTTVACLLDQKHRDTGTAKNLSERGGGLLTMRYAIWFTPSLTANSDIARTLL